MITQLRLKVIQLWILFQYGFIESYQVMIQEAYDHNETIDLLWDLYRTQTDEYIAECYYGLGQMDTIVPEGFGAGLTCAEYISLLADGMHTMENVVEYMTDPNKYMNAYWNQHYNKYREDFDQMNDHGL